MFICHCRLHCYQNEKQQKRLVMLVQLLRLEMQSWWRNLKIQSEKWINFRNLCRGLCRKSLFPSSGCQLSWHSNVSVTHITSLDASVCKNPSLTFLFLHVALYVSCLIETFWFNIIQPLKVDSFYASGWKRSLPIQNLRFKYFVSSHWQYHQLGNLWLQDKEQWLFRYKLDIISSLYILIF